jgi:predicted transcriptional regulator
MPEKALISEELRERVETFARDENREPSDVVEEALGRYLASQRLEKLGRKFERRALESGIREEDISDIVHEVRRENRARGR